MTDVERITRQIRQLIEARQFRRALELLNKTTDCRFSALYHFTASGAANLMIYDREGDPPAALLVVPPGASYCEIVRDTHLPFTTEDSTRDERLEAHPSRLMVQSYAGFPLVSVDGSVFGTLCHFDFSPNDIPAEACEISAAIARSVDASTGITELQDAINHRLDTLATMGDAIRDAFADRAGIRDAFESYAQPILQQAQALPAGSQATLRKNLDAMLGLLLQDVA